MSNKKKSFLKVDILLDFVQISELIKDSPLIIMAGAGISMDDPSSLPSAKTIMDSLIEYGAVEEYIETIKKIDGLRYEYIVQLFRDNFDKDLKFIEFFIQDFEPNSIHNALADIIKNDHIVITTNFDTLIEQALGKATNIQNSQLKAIITEEDYTSVNLSEKPLKILFKLHGSPINYFTKKVTKASVVTTLDLISTNKERDQEIMSLPKFKQTIVQKLHSGRVLIVMGYGGGDSFDIMPEIALMNKLTALIWIEHMHDLKQPAQWKVKNSFDEKTELDRFLSKIKETSPFPVYKLQGNTKLLIEQLFKEQSQIIQIDYTVFKKPDFKQWINKQFPIIPEEKSKLYFTVQCLDFYQKYTEELNLLQQIKKFADSHNDEFMKSYSLITMGLIYQDTNNPEKALELYEQAYTIDEAQNYQQGMGTALNNMGRLYQERGNPNKALELYEQAYDIFNELNNQQSMSTILNNMGLICQDSGNYEKALELYSQAYTIDKELGNQQNAAVKLSNMGSVYQDTGDPEKGLELYEQAYTIDKALGNQHDMTIRLCNMGLIYQDSGRPEKALELYEQAYTINKSLGNQQGIAAVLNNIGSVYQDMGNLTKALELYNEALNIDKIMGNKLSMSILLNNIGMIYQENGNLGMALELYQQAYTIDNELGNQQGIAIRLNNLGSIYNQMGDSRKALKFYEQAYAINKTLGNQLALTTDLNNIGSIYKQIGNPTKALEFYEQAHAINKELGNQSGIAIDLNNIGTIYQDASDFDKALELYEQAYTIDKALGNQFDMGIRLSNMGTVYYSLHDTVNALSVFEQALRIFSEIGYLDGVSANQIWIDRIKTKK